VPAAAPAAPGAAPAAAAPAAAGAPDQKNKIRMEALKLMRRFHVGTPSLHACVMAMSVVSGMVLRLCAICNQPCWLLLFWALQVLGASGCSEEGTPAANVLKALRACKNAGSGIPDLQLQVRD
jgi:hypothetical protein